MCCAALQEVLKYLTSYNIIGKGADSFETYNAPGFYLFLYQSPKNDHILTEGANTFVRHYITLWGVLMAMK